MQRVYTDDRTLDECIAVYDRDVVMVPKGYHPVATMAGYDSYYLNVMAAGTQMDVYLGKKTTRGLIRIIPPQASTEAGFLPGGAALTRPVKRLPCF